MNFSDLRSYMDEEIGRLFSVESEVTSCHPAPQMRATKISGRSGGKLCSL